MSNLKCLLIDDDAEDLEIFTSVITQIDPTYKFLTAIDCVEGLKLLRSKPLLVPDYIFLDLNMPVLNGIEAMEQIKNLKQLVETPVIFYTTSSDTRDIEETKRLGAKHYFVKPSDLNFLFNKLSALFKNQITSFLIKQPENYCLL